MNYSVTDKETGRTLKLTGDSPPTEAELNDIFSKLKPATATKKSTLPERRVGGVLGFGSVPESEFKEGRRNLLGNIFERPGAAVRATLRSFIPGGETPSEAYSRGSLTPGTVQRFQDEALEKLPTGVVNRLIGKGKIPSNMATQALAFGEEASRGSVVSAAGLLADIVTNPADVLLAFLGRTPIGKGRTVGGVVSKARPVKAVGRFCTKERGIPGRGLLRKGIKAAKELKEPAKITAKEAITKEITVNKAARKQALSKVVAETDRKVIRAANKIDDEVLDLTAKLQKSSEGGTLEIQRRVPKSQRAAGKVYKENLDGISNNLAKKGAEITQSDGRIAIINTLDEAELALLPEGPASKGLKQLLETKYTAQGKGKSVPLDEFYADVKAVRNLISPSPGRPFSPDENIVAIFNKNVGTLLEQKAPALIELNKSYAPVIRMNKATHSLFKPRGGEFVSERGTSLIQKQALKKVSKTGKVSAVEPLKRGERELLRILQEGTGFSPGIGKVTGPSERVGSRIVGRQVAKIKSKEAITKIGKVKAERIGNKFDKELAKLMAKDEAINQALRDSARRAKVRNWAIGLVAAGATIGGAITMIKSGVSAVADIAD